MYTLVYMFTLYCTHVHFSVHVHTVLYMCTLYCTFVDSSAVCKTTCIPLGHLRELCGDVDWTLLDRISRQGPASRRIRGGGKAEINMNK